MDLDYVVDFQSFVRSSNILQIKELSIIPVLESLTQVVTYLFKEPCKWNKLCDSEKRVNKWLTRKFHKISWSSGTTNSNDLIKILQNHLHSARTIFCKGLQKSRLLKFFLPTKLV